MKTSEVYNKGLAPSGGKCMGTSIDGDETPPL